MRDRLFSRICNYILALEVKALANLTRDSLAKKFDVSNSWLSQIFKENIGVTFGDFIDSIRIIRAQEMIRSKPDIPIREISKIVGIEKTQVFRNKFKTKFGITPGEYKKSYKNKD